MLERFPVLWVGRQLGGEVEVGGKGRGGVVCRELVEAHGTGPWYEVRRRDDFAY